MLAVLFCVQIEQGTGDQVIQTLHQPEARLLVQQKKNQQSEWYMVSINSGHMYMYMYVQYVVYV